MIPSNTLKIVHFPGFNRLVALLSLAITLALLLWSTTNYHAVPIVYGPRAIYSMIVLSIVLGLLGRILLLHVLRVEVAETESVRERLLTVTQPLFLLDTTAPLYLAAGVLIGVPASVLVALLTQAVLQGYTILRKFASWSEASYRIATTGLVALISSTIYVWVAGPAHNHLLDVGVGQIAESREFLGSILAAIVILLLFVLVSLPVMKHGNHSTLKAAWYEYTHSPALLFQAMVLSVGPLLPVVDIFDDNAGELAWLFFLVPLFTIYYLALSSTQLRIRTNELQHTLQDLNSAQRRQNQLRDYASLITRVQEEERRRLARELHDDTAQALIALSLGLDGLGRAMGKLPLPEKDVQWLASLQNLAGSTLEGVRRACRDLRPSVLDDLGLQAAIEWLSDSSAARGVPCTFTCSGSPQPAPPEAEIAIFRIVQEALSNVWRHSHANQASIELKYMPDLLQVLVSDNGQGFVVDQYNPALPHSSQSSLGLLGMRERAALIGAALSITSSLNQGCTIFLSLPLESS